MFTHFIIILQQTESHYHSWEERGHSQWKAITHLNLTNSMCDLEAGGIRSHRNITVGGRRIHTRGVLEEQREQQTGPS